MEALSGILLSAILFIMTLSLILMLSIVRSSTKKINDQNDKRNKEVMSRISEMQKSNDEANNNIISTLNEVTKID